MLLNGVCRDVAYSQKRRSPNIALKQAILWELGTCLAIIGLLPPLVSPAFGHIDEFSSARFVEENTNNSSEHIKVNSIANKRIVPNFAGQLVLDVHESGTGSSMVSCKVAERGIDVLNSGVLAQSLSFNLTKDIVAMEGVALTTVTVNGRFLSNETEESRCDENRV